MLDDFFSWPLIWSWFRNFTLKSNKKKWLNEVKIIVFYKLKVTSVISAETALKIINKFNLLLNSSSFFNSNLQKSESCLLFSTLLSNQHLIPVSHWMKPINCIRLRFFSSFLKREFWGNFSAIKISLMLHKLLKILILLIKISLQRKWNWTYICVFFFYISIRWW